MTVDESPRPYPFEPFRGDLPGELLEMVRTRPVSRVRLPDGRPVWLVVGWAEVCAVLTDRRFSRRGPGTDRADCPAREPSRELSMDGTPHTDLRRLAARAFTARRIARYRPLVQAVTDRLLDGMAAAGPPADLVAALVVPMPDLVICELLGVPAADRDRFAAWVDAMLSVTAHGSPEAARAEGELRTYLAGRLAHKRERPGDDLLSAWAAAQATDPLTDGEVVGLAVGVLLGGREISTISAGVRALFAHPQAMDRLRAEPGLLPAAVEEILRYTSVSPFSVVQTVVDNVALGGETLRAGDRVMAVPWAANRHPDVFAEPDTFDLERTENPHLAFGLGPHFCLGAALGRLEVEVAIGTLLRRFPRLAPAVPLADLPWRDERVNCGLAAFPVTW